MSCDSIYFETYFPEFLNSYEASGQKSTLIYVVAINPKKDQINEIQSYNECDFIHIEIISFDLRGYSDSWKKIFLCLCPIFPIPFIIEDSKLPVIVTDIDVKVSSNISSPLNLLQGSDVGVCSGVSSFKHYYPWTKASAGFLILSGNENSLNFSLILRDYILSAFNYNPASSNWGVDQTALYFSIISMEKDFKDFTWAKLRLSMATQDQKGRY